ncbi:MAG TPA: FHA domain-containing protein [Chthoniobacteraceae bacterium]|jgi:pSer/pThr/pTyr-binding forkhead associated (FHA) protein|nr:FHA domain-containing protein [Chthoniobacteraceae bacterium]
MPSPSFRQLEILVSRGERHYARCLLVPGEYNLGQGRRNDIMVDEDSVSSSHARLTYLEGGGVYIQDAGSANGTFVDDEFADQPLFVGAGARVQVGGCCVVLRAVG